MGPTSGMCSAPCHCRLSSCWNRGDKDWAEPVGAGPAVSLLAGLGLQTSKCVLREKPLDEIAASTLQRFENLCDLVQAVPAYLLDLGINGTFWQEIERVTQCTEPGGSA
jgi:hypothetical protein